MIGKRLINTGVAAAEALVPSENFNTVLYTGNGSTQRIGGYINRGAVFNGSSSKITNTGFSITGNRSVSFWVRMNSSSSQNTGILSTWNDGADYLEGITVRGGASNTNFVLSVDTTNHTIAALNTNWNHIAIIYDGTYYQAYFNGTQVLTNISVQSSIEKLSNLQLGARHTPTDTQYFSGKIDQVRVFDKALSSSEVTTLYGETHASTTISTTDIFSDNSGVALYQLDGNANDTGGVTGRTEGTESAIFSNADNSNFNLGNATVVNNSFGVSFWVKMNKISQSENVYLCSFMYGSNTSLYMDTSNVLQVSNGGYSRNESFSTTHTFAADTWYHIVYTGQIVGDGTLRCYVNGTQVGSRGWITGHNYTLTSGNRIGSYNNGDQSIDGQIADFRIYKSTHLSSSDVTALYSGTPPTTGLTEYYKFDGNDRNYAGDRQLTPSNVIYNYSGTATNVTYQEATNFTPDLVWIKNRNSTLSHTLIDSVRGGGYGLRSDLSAAEQDYSSGGIFIDSFDSNGFTIGSGTQVNTNNYTYAAWCFKGGGTAVSNTDGTITSSVSANQDAGFSICSWNTQSSNGTYTIGHGLSSAPELIINKDRDSSSNWVVWSSEFSTPANDFMYLNSASAKNSSTDSGSVITSTTFNTKTGHDFLTNKNIVSYCFHSVDGYSKIGSYTGTGAAGNSVVTGFQPQFLLIKNTSSGTNNWIIVDEERSTSNPRKLVLEPNTSDAESTETVNINFTSNGFELTNGNSDVNDGSATYIYLAIAADPDTTTPTVENSFDVVTYTGNGSTQEIATDFKPDLVWIKNRSSAQSHRLVDSVRGDYNLLFSDLTNANDGPSSSYPSIESNGFALNSTESNASSTNYVAWCWKAGDHDDNLPQINTEGSIDSVVSVNAEAGFSIVKYTGNGGSGQSVGHGLSSAPEMVIFKRTDAAQNWFVFVKVGGVYKRFEGLNTTAAATSVSSFSASSTSITWSGTTADFNGSSREYIMYCFHSVSGYQKIGSFSYSVGYSENVGFEPRFLLMKKTSSTGSWYMIDNKRVSGTNNYGILANSSAAEDTGTDYITFTSTGFTTTYSDSGTYIYLAIK